MIDVKSLLTLANFRQLGDVALIDIATNAIVMESKKGTRLLAEDLLDEELYLLGGEIELQDDSRLKQTIRAGEDRAQHPIFRVNAPGLSGRCTNVCKILKVNRQYINKYNIHRKHDVKDIKVEEVEDLPRSGSAEALAREVLEHFNHRDIEIPSLPEIATHINEMIEQKDIGFRRLAGAIQTDPVISARVVQVSNSAMYGTRTKIESIQQAITRIGLEAVRAIVMSVVIRNLFEPQFKLIKKTMARYYENSIRTAVVCYGLAKTLPDFNPDHAFLVGLLHDIGVIPILVIADNHAELSRNAGHLDSVIFQLRAQIGGKLLREWGFDEEYAIAAEQSHEWDRQIEQADYCDLVQTALMHSPLVGGERISGPELRELPAFIRLGLDKVDPQKHIKLLKELSSRIKELISMLCS